MAAVLVTLMVLVGAPVAHGDQSAGRRELVAETGDATLYRRMLLPGKSDRICNYGNPDAKYIRLKIKANAPLVDGDTVVLWLDRVTFRMRLPAELFANPNWTPQLPGACTWVKNNTGTSLIVLRILNPVAKATLKSHFPPGEKPSYKDPVAFPFLRETLGGMSLVLYMKDDLEKACTGFALAPDIVLTNHHCIKTEEQAQSATLKFGPRIDGSARQVVNGASLMVQSAPHDASFIRLREWISDTFSVLPWREGPPIKRERIVVVHHPAANALKVSDDENCRVGGIKLADAMDFGHRCDTEGGSSGAMVVGMSLRCRQVVGLHHWGAATNDGKGTNQAVRIDQLAAFLRDAAAHHKDPDVRTSAKEVLTHLTFSRCG